MSLRRSRYAQLVKLCRMRGCSREDASDVVQEAHLRLLDYERSARVKDADSLLRRIVINLSINYYHREPSARFTFESIDELSQRQLLINPAPNPERTLVAEEQLDRVVSLLSSVSIRTCQIFIAQRAGYSYDEIASAFAVKPRTVEKHVASAMLVLQETITEDSAPNRPVRPSKSESIGPDDRQIDE